MIEIAFNRDRFWYKQRFIDYTIHRRKYTPRTLETERKVFGYFNEFCLSYIAYIEMALTFQHSENNRNQYKDRELAVDVMYSYMKEHTDTHEILLTLKPMIEEMKGKVINLSEIINFRGTDLDLFRAWDVNNPETLHSLLLYFYRMRCMFFHGDKFDFVSMIAVLRPTCQCLREINFTLFRAMKEDLNR